MALKDKPTLTANYDLRGNTVPRMMRHWVRMKTSLMGNYDTGPGLRCMLTLWLLHTLGKPLFAIRTWMKNQYDLKARIKSLLHRRRRKEQESNEFADD